jgi:YebC/PmpR family DNA-binding regulatory protein
MSGHNKWSTIKHKKGAADAKRSKVFTKILKEISVAARLGGGDINANPRLRSAVEKGKIANMPKENIDRAIKKGTGELEGVTYEEITYEGVGPGGSAFMVETLTDNANRTVAEIRSVFGKLNGNMGKAGTVSWKFDHKGVIEIPKDSITEDQLMELALDLGADDIKNESDEVFTILTPFVELSIVTEGLRAKGLKIESSDPAWIPKGLIKLTGREAEIAFRLFNNLDDHDDVQNVYHDFDIDEEELNRIADK